MCDHRTTRRELLSYLDSLGLATRTVEHTPVATVAANKALRGELPGAHTKNLFLKDKKGGLWLVVALEDRQIDLKALRTLLGAPALSFARPDVMRSVLGIEPGSVTPFAVINDRQRLVTVILDAQMMTMDPLNFHPLENTATTAISPAALHRFLDALDHPPRTISFGDDEPQRS
ncbi:MAG: prolyl-tRNA synthetase associated domain-containing protein [Rhodospirillales bacterium]|nr:prolyl-tRNA synthetase associated domain-containing protein [Rhodospirillales bacterium]